MDRPEQILAILDAACMTAFPMLDNGHVYLAATRLSLFRSPTDWAMVFEVFGYSPHGAVPAVDVCTFASRLHDRRTNFGDVDAFRRHLEHHPHDESEHFMPLGKLVRIDDEAMFVEECDCYSVRGIERPIPARTDYAMHGIDLADPTRVHVHELCRYIAATDRDAVLATMDERRRDVRPEMQLILQLDDWRHPDTAAGELPSHTETFRQLAYVLSTGDVSAYRPTEAGNTHWLNWPEGGTL